MPKQSLVNFLIVGTQKGGTTALAEFLAGHPEICFCNRKEAHLFDSPSFDERLSPDEIDLLYRPFFTDYTGQPLVGEATPAYLFLPPVAARIYRYNPRMKIIILLRDPVARALSQYAMERARGTEKRPLFVSLLAEWYRFRKNPADFNTLLRDEPVRRFCYLERGFYLAQVRRYQALFPPENVLLLPSEQLWDEHEKVLGLVYDFLGVGNREYLPPRTRVFATPAGPRPRLWSRLLLSLLYRREICRLAQHLGWDLAHWGRW